VEIKKGEVWHVRLKGAAALMTAEITDVTSSTIELDEKYNVPWRSYPSRYTRDDVEMIERISG